MTAFSDEQNNQSKNTAPDMPVILLVDDNAINLQIAFKQPDPAAYRA